MEELFGSGDLPGLHRQAAADVAAQPREASARAFFVQVLCMEAQWERAATQVDALLKLNPSAAVFCSTLMQLIDAERERDAVFTGRNEVPWLGEPAPYAADFAGGIRAYACGDVHVGARAVARVMEVLPVIPAVVTDGTQCAWLLDGDARLCGVLEFIRGGRYCLVEQTKVKTLEVAAPAHPVDVLWPHVRMQMRNGDTLVGRMPGRYVCFPGEEDSALLMARETAWQDGGEGLYLGRGQRCWNTAEGLRPMLREARITFGDMAS